MQFSKWIESDTYSHNLKMVYHWDIESDWNKVLQKQDPNYGLWVSPNKDWNDHWASTIVSGSGDFDKHSFYLHIIGMPRELFRKYHSNQQTVPSRFGIYSGEAKEFVISPEDWDRITPVNVIQYKRSDMLKKHFRHLRRKEQHEKRPTGFYSTSNHPGSTGNPVSDREVDKWKKDKIDF